LAPNVGLFIICSQKRCQFIVWIQKMAFENVRGFTEFLRSVVEVADIREEVPVSEMVELRLVGVWRVRAAVDVVGFQ
jgi:hypothetical protein